MSSTYCNTFSHRTCEDNYAPAMDINTEDTKLKHFLVEDASVGANIKSNDHSVERYNLDPEAEKRLLRKIDLRVIPILWLLFMLAFLDRANSTSSPASAVHH